MMAARSEIAPLPLLNWPEQVKIDALKQQREKLQATIDRLRPNSHRRIILQARLSELTAKELQLEVKEGLV